MVQWTEHAKEAPENVREDSSHQPKLSPEVFHSQPSSISGSSFMQF